MDLTEIRKEIDALDAEVTRLLCRRMELVTRVAEYKKQHGLAVLDTSREAALLARIAALSGPGQEQYMQEIYRKIMQQSRAYQTELLSSGATAASSSEEPSCSTSAASYGLLGEHLAHSRSPLIHSKFGSYDYQLFPVARESLDFFLKSNRFSGLNVTIPYKETVLPYCAQLSDAARRIGSVNTMLRQPDGAFFGYNTDYDGFCYLVRRMSLDCKGKKALVFGSGGASKAVCCALQDLGCRKVLVISRSGENNYQNLSRHLDAEIIVNTTPVGMYPENGASLLPEPVSEASQSPAAGDVSRTAEPDVSLKDFTSLSAVIDIIYNPLRTALLLQAKKLRIPNSNGMPMLVAQAAKASTLFTGVPVPTEKTDAVTDELIRREQNIVLIGMPGVGKTTIGTLLAKQLNRELLDTDALIFQKTGKQPAELITEQGEAYFRELESEVVKAVGKQTGKVIATGGGVVTRMENYDALAQNGTLLFLQRELSLLATNDRPLSTTCEQLQQRYTERLPLYRAFADVEIPLFGTPEEICSRLLKQLGYR